MDRGVNAPPVSVNSDFRDETGIDYNENALDFTNAPGVEISEICIHCKDGDA